MICKIYTGVGVCPRIYGRQSCLDYVPLTRHSLGRYCHHKMKFLNSYPLIGRASEICTKITIKLWSATLKESELKLSELVGEIEQS